MGQLDAALSATGVRLGGEAAAGRLANPLLVFLTPERVLELGVHHVRASVA